MHTDNIEQVIDDTFEPTIDVEVSDEGSVWTFVFLTTAAREWCTEHVAAEGWQWLGKALVVDWRFAERLIDGLRDDGLRVG